MSCGRAIDCFRRYPPYTHRLPGAACAVCPRNRTYLRNDDWDGALVVVKLRGVAVAQWVHRRAILDGQRHLPVVLRGVAATAAERRLTLGDVVVRDRRGLDLPRLGEVAHQHLI